MQNSKPCFVVSVFRTYATLSEESGIELRLDIHLIEQQRISPVILRKGPQALQYPVWIIPKDSVPFPIIPDRWSTL